MVYTIKQLAKLAGVTVRTLHYYDEIGLLKPSFTKDNGYRCYEEKELVKLQQILFFRELDFALDDIIHVMNTPDYNMLEVLTEQRNLLAMEKRRLDVLLQAIDKTIEVAKKGDFMSTNDLFASFANDEIEQYKEEVKAKWGNTETYKQSVNRTKQWTKRDFDRIKEEGQAITLSLSQLIDKGVADTEVQQQIGQYFQHINQFYDCSYNMYRQLGIMYVEDTRFADNYNNVHPHLAEFMRDAIACYCDQHKN